MPRRPGPRTDRIPTPEREENDVLPLPLNGLPNDLRPTAAYGAAILHALSREEAAGGRPRRLTEPGLATWTRFEHLRDPLLLSQDAAVSHPVPFAGQLSSAEDLRVQAGLLWRLGSKSARAPRVAGAGREPKSLAVAQVGTVQAVRHAVLGVDAASGSV